ncbi:hypothetical protein Pelo_15590 [Pelomyxa schiedti]|nr:hypothetical protein Pelo_15590 [Pelomyxa schiedti]
MKVKSALIEAQQQVMDLLAMKKVAVPSSTPQIRQVPGATAPPQLCVECDSEPISKVFQPCGHACANTFKKCPQCRSLIVTRHDKSS